MRIRPKRIYVYPTFEKKLKKMSIEHNQSVIALTRDLAKDEDLEFLKDKLSIKRRPNEYRY